MKTKTCLKLALLFGAAGIANCSNQSLYNALHQSRFQACEEAPIQTQEACRAQYSVSFDDYTRAREELIRSSSTASR